MVTEGRLCSGAESDFPHCGKHWTIGESCIWNSWYPQNGWPFVSQPKTGAQTHGHAFIGIRPAPGTGSGGGEVEPIEVHDPVPCFDEVADKLLRRVLAGVNLGDRAQL